MYRLLVDKDATNIIVPTVEDDPTFVQSPLHPSLAIGNTHVRNIIAWRQFTFNRTLHFWRQGSPQGKLVWYKAFYQVDHINVYEAPSTTSVSLIRFPPSIFIHPFWNNDLEIANFAGGRILAAKAWMTALTFDFADYNVEQSIISHRSKGAAYWEGVSTLSSYKRCLAVTYNWFHPKERDVSELAGVALTSFDPHFLALRYGFHKTGTFDHIDNDRVEAGTGIWPTSLPVKTMLRAYFRQVRDVRENPGDDFFTPKIRKKLRYSKLIGFEAFSEAQLFFLINFREICRSRDDESDFYKGHVIENLSGFMQMEEFANVWHCPPNGGMNPPKPCFKENWKTGKSE
ncbi:uncharacterized protein LOC118435429 [Folsomia candida]|nr:uncharacterized protein LOC118435429 [Folsomia candida]